MTLFRKPTETYPRDFESQRPRKICIFMDGTSNSPEDETNISWLHLQATSDEVLQRNVASYYDVGVGVGFPFIQGNVFGRGFERKVISAYEFLSRTYRGPADKIYVFGFSRGARQAQVLVDFLHTIGLPGAPPTFEDPDNKRERLKWAKALFERYKKYNESTRTLCNNEHFEAALPESERQFQPVPVEVIGIFDSVESLTYNLWQRLKTGKAADTTPRRDFRYEPSANIVRGYHAMALDEYRQAFDVIKWGQQRKSENSTELLKNIPGQVIEQVWFAGTHSDIGGNRARQCNWALSWMIESISNDGILPSTLSLSVKQEILHDSRKGITKSLPGFKKDGYPRFERFWTVYNHLGESLGSTRGDTFVQREMAPKVHESVIRRMDLFPLPAELANGNKSFETERETPSGKVPLYRPAAFGVPADGFENISESEFNFYGTDPEKCVRHNTSNASHYRRDELVDTSEGAEIVPGRIEIIPCDIDRLSELGVEVTV